MAVPIIYQMPAVIESGDTVRVQIGFPNFPASSCTAALKLNIPGTAPTSIAGSAASNGTDFLFVISAAVTAALSAGFYDYVFRVTETSSGEVSTGGTGGITVLPNLGGTITKSLAEQQLDAANTALLSLVSKANSSVSFNGQSFTKENQLALMDIIARLRTIVNAERAQQAALRGDARTRSIAPFFS